MEELRVSGPVQERIDVLAGLANEAPLSVEERGEYEALVERLKATGPASPADLMRYVQGLESFRPWDTRK